MAYTNNNGQSRVGVRIVPLSVVIPTISTLLDSYSGAAAAYSLRKLKSSYGGSAIRVRRSSDNTEQNIGFDSVGNLDTYALSAFVGTGNGFVTTWYDQSGNNRDATQTTAGNQPQIVSSGIIINLNNKSSIYFNGSSFMNTIQNVLSVGNGGYSVFGLGRPGGSPNCLFYIGSSTGNNGVGLNNNNGTPRHYWFANDYDSGQTFVNTNSIFVISYDGTKRYTTINNVTTSANSSGKNTTNPTLSIGRLPGYSQNLVGYESELVIYDLNKESIRTNITNDINSYYSVYPNPTSVWNLLNAVYSADTTASSSLKTSLFAAYNGESNANDSFGTNNGTAQGGLTYTTGKIGNAFQFNGTNAYVSLPDNSLNFTGDFSVSLWIYPTFVDGVNYRIITTNNYTSGTYGNGWQIARFTDNSLNIMMVRDGSTAGIIRCVSSNSIIPSNAWTHLVITRKKSTSTKVYANGADVTASFYYSFGNATIDPVYVSPQYCQIGANKFNSNPATGFMSNGTKIDALNIWNKELTQSEITELYNSGNGAQYITDNFYKPTTNDALNTYNGTAVGGLTYGLGKVGTAFVGNGTNAYVGLPNNSFNFTGDFSISVWSNFQGASGTVQALLSNITFNGTNGLGYLLYYYNQDLTFQISNNSGYTLLTYSISSLFYNWNNVVITRKASTGTKIYINGNLVTSNLDTRNPSYAATMTPSIGAANYGPTYGNLVQYYASNGTKLDALNIWTKELTQAEVTELYNSGNGKQYPN